MGPMQASVSGNWIEAPEGRLGRVELHDLAARLGRITHDTRELIIDMQKVNHLDYRGLSEIAFQIQRLLGRGVIVQCSGFSPYLLAIWRYALSLEGMELVAGLAGGYERLPAQDCLDRLGGRVPVTTSWSLSEN